MIKTEIFLIYYSIVTLFTVITIAHEEETILLCQELDREVWSVQTPI